MIDNLRKNYTLLYVKLLQAHVDPNTHRRAGNFLPGGSVNLFPKKISQVAQIFTKESKRNQGHITTDNIGRTGV